MVCWPLLECETGPPVGRVMKRIASHLIATRGATDYVVSLRDLGPEATANVARLAKTQRDCYERVTIKVIDYRESADSKQHDSRVASFVRNSAD